MTPKLVTQIPWTKEGINADRITAGTVIHEHIAVRGPDDEVIATFFGPEREQNAQIFLGSPQLFEVLAKILQGIEGGHIPDQTLINHGTTESNASLTALSDWIRETLDQASIAQDDAPEASDDADGPAP